MYKAVKRFIDIVIAIIVLLVLSPLFVLVIILLLLTGEHKVFYFQKRIGYRNRPFYIWKFATMLKDSPNIGTGEITLRNDPRVTPVGKFLRRTKINELPQVINVLKGDMSMVGPRPLMEVSFNLYSEDDRNSIYSVRPGITGIGSVIFRDEEKILSDAPDPRAKYNSIYPYKAELEKWYRCNQSLLIDSLIIMLTALILFSPHSLKPNKVFKQLPQRDF